MVALGLIEQSTYFFSTESERFLYAKRCTFNPDDGVAFFPAFDGFVGLLRDALAKSLSYPQQLVR